MSSRQPFSPNPRPKTTIIFLAITIAASLIILSAILYFVYYLWYSLVRRSRTSPFDGASPLNKLQKFSYRELKNATHNFSSSNSIGKGGSGSVFRGILKDGKLVAVKLLDSNSFQCEQEFQNELKILSGVKPCPLIVSLCGFCLEKGNRLLVFEYMPNRSLQESLFSDSSNNDIILNWGRRYSVILDIAKALAFLHLECDPPIIHGDVKPSNVLLDSEFRAKLSDFGLSRLKDEGEFGAGLFSQDLSNSNIGLVGGEYETPPIGTPVESHGNDEVDFAMALQASSSSKNSCKVYHNAMGLAINSLNFNFSSGGNEGNSKGKELSENGDDELSSMDHSKELNLNSKQWGKDWWWKQDGSGELCSKDYVMEWIGSQICPSTNPISDWDEEKGDKTGLDKREEVNEQHQVQEVQLQELDGDDARVVIKKEDSKRWRVRANKHRKMYEWWKDEHLEEISKKGKFKAAHFGLGKCFAFRTRRRGKFVHENETTNDKNMEFSFRKGWRKKNSPSMGSEDLFSRELSSTTSMRGTLCYVAPEYGGYDGYLMEKGDIYSLGVLILVIVSGRRPLHVLSSPMKLEKANLISWARSLAKSGNVLELVDERLGEEYCKVQARLCIDLAVACLRRMAEMRPDIGDVVKVLKGEMDIPAMPFEFSAASPPPPRNFSRSRRREKSNVD